MKDLLFNSRDGFRLDQREEEKVDFYTSVAKDPTIIRPFLIVFGFSSQKIRDLAVVQLKEDLMLDDDDD